MTKHDMAHKLVQAYKRLKEADNLATQPAVIDAVREARGQIYDIVEAIGPDLLRRSYD